MKAWSISALSSFETCPKRYYNVNVAKKFVEEKGEAVTWGSEVHKAFERYLSMGTSFPVGMKNLETIAKRFDAAGQQADEVFVETKLALNAELQPVTYFAKDTWVRSVIDYGILKDDRVAIIDWKTGKKKSNDDQLALMAGMAMAKFPQVTTVSSTFIWLQEPPAQQVEVLSYNRENLGKIWGRFLPRVDRLQEAFVKEEFPARPSGLCRKYCPVTSCIHHGT